MQSTQYVAFLRGINVGGYHKVPMAALKEVLEEAGNEDILTILNSGNVIFGAPERSKAKLQDDWEVLLEAHFGFPVPTIIRSGEELLKLVKQEPFQAIELTKDIRRYVSFLPKETDPGIRYPWTSTDLSFQILAKEGLQLLSVLDLSVTKTPKGMEALEKLFGKRITTRNWNTIERIVKKLA